MKRPLAFAAFLVFLGTEGMQEVTAKKSKSKSKEKPHSTNTDPQAHPHPLDSLNANEILQTKSIILKNQPNKEKNYSFNIMLPKEPPKSALLPYFLKGVSIPKSAYVRKSHTVLVESGTKQVYEAVVNLDKGTLESWTKMPEDFMPVLTPDDDSVANALVHGDPGVIARCASKGFTDMSLVYTATWPLGYNADRPEYKDLKRPYEIFMYGLNDNDDNAYAHPMDFVVIVDIATEKVIGIEDLPTHEDFDKGANKEGNTIPREPANYDYNLRPEGFLRKDDKPIKVTSPEGSSFTLRGNEIQWQKFNMHIGFNAREGLYMNTITYNDSGKIRPLVYRASVAEMAVYYGDPRPPYHRKHGFDEGELGLGYRANELISQEDCVGKVQFITITLNNSTGDPVTKKNAICIVEEDAGILWKHIDLRTGKRVATRSHRLSIGMSATMGNYDYLMKWLFYQDASIQFQIQMSGILSSNMMAVDATPAGYGTRVFPQVNAQYHQHLFALRFDTEIDGNKNSVYTSDVVSSGATGSPANLHGLGLTVNKTYMKTQIEGRAKTNSSSGRVWIVTNPGKIHPYTKSPVGWKLVPSNDPQVLMQPDSPVHPRFGFLDYDVWVTKFHEDQLFPGGFYLNNSGVPEWTSTNPDESIDNEDIVVWHMFNPMHIPRVEDFPAMPVETRDVWLKPYNFFMENPALDVPPPSARSRPQQEL